MNEKIKCPVCKGKALWSLMGSPMACDACGWSGEITGNKLMSYLIQKVEKLEFQILRDEKKGVA